MDWLLSCFLRHSSIILRALRAFVVKPYAAVLACISVDQRFRLPKKACQENKILRVCFAEQPQAATREE